MRSSDISAARPTQKIPDASNPKTVLSKTEPNTPLTLTGRTHQTLIAARVKTFGIMLVFRDLGKKNLTAEVGDGCVVLMR